MKRRACAHCGKPLPKDASASRKYCDAECRARKKPLASSLGPVAVATEVAIAAAQKAKTLTDDDAGAIAALRALANKIDVWEQIVDYALDDLAGKPQGARPAVPQNDNVSLPTYLKYCESLGLTPAGRSRMTEKKPEGKRGGKLGKLSAVPKPA